MKSLLTAGGLGSGVAAVLAARGPGLVLVAAVVLGLAAIVVSAVCWVVNSRDRTTHTVDLIAAVRQNQQPPQGRQPR